MKITTVIHVTVEHTDGTSTSMGRTHVKKAGDNPRFERTETSNALDDAAAEFMSVHSLEGTRPL